MIEKAVAAFPNFQAVATTLRNVRSASVNDWAAVLYTGGRLYRSRAHDALEIWDRVGGGDSFASGLIYGFLAGKDPQWAVDCGAAHGALAMTTPGRHHDGEPRRGRARDEGRLGPRPALSGRRATGGRVQAPASTPRTHGLGPRRPPRGPDAVLDSLRG